MLYEVITELISIANEIVAYKAITDYYSAPDFPLKKLGVILSTPNLLDDTYEYLIMNKLEVNKENLDKFTQMSYNFV